MIGVSPVGVTGAESQGSAPVFSGSPKRVVLDTNVLVSLYVFSDSRFAPLRGKIESGAWRALTSAACLEEFRRVLGYPQFALDAGQRQGALEAYLGHVERIDTVSAVKVDLPRCKDRDDQKFLELARDGAAEWLVTADKALLRLARRDKLRGLFRILTPETALAES